MVKCKICLERFEPKFFLQKHCNNDVCKDKWRELVLEEKKQVDNDFRSKSKPIKKVSDKKTLQDIIYKSERIKFLSLPENKICPITKKPASEIHHTYCGKDRAKYYLDTSTWLAVSREGHNFIHDNPKESREKGYLK